MLATKLRPITNQIFVSIKFYYQSLQKLTPTINTTTPFPIIPKLENCRNTLYPLKDYFAIGFDVDHCLVRNRVKEIFPLLCNCLYRVLVEEKGYPQSMFEFNTFEKNFFMNGLVIDLKNANILKLGEGKQVLRAYFGYRRLTQKEIEKEYGSPPTFDVFDPMNIFTDDYACYLSFFDCYYPLVFAKMVDYKRKGKDYLDKEQIREIMNDTTYAVDKNYRHCNKNKYTSITEFGYYYKEILANKERYLYKHDQMVEALKSLKNRGKILFLISDSHYEFVEALLTYGYGEFWKELFDYHIVYAKKRRFFGSTDKLFKRVDFSKDSKIGEKTDKLVKKQMYTRGNALLLEKNLREAAGKYNDGRILYIGDHYSHDVLASRALKDWDSVCVMEELGGLDLGEEFDARVWGPSHYEETPYGVVPTFWYSQMMEHANKCTKLVDSEDMLEFFYQEETDIKAKGE